MYLCYNVIFVLHIKTSLATRDRVSPYIDRSLIYNGLLSFLIIGTYAFLGHAVGRVFKKSTLKKK